MTKEKVANQEVEEQDAFANGEASASCEDEQCANMAEDEGAGADTMAEEETSEQGSVAEPTPEEVIAVWRDKYMRLQAEFDNYRKRTLREKMDLVASGGADVLISSLFSDAATARCTSSNTDNILFNTSAPPLATKSIFSRNVRLR